MNKLLLLLYFLSFSCFSQMTKKEELATLITFNYLHNQAETLKYISSNYPEQSDACKLVELKFAKKYGIAQKDIQLKVKKIYGDNFEKYLSDINNNLQSYFNSNKMTLKESVNYIQRVKHRANGFIESPVHETLIKHQQMGLATLSSTILYQVENYTQNDKIKFSINIPSNWKEIEGSSPSILKMFRNNEGLGEQIIAIHKFENTHSVSSFSDKTILNSIPKNSFNVVMKKKVINNELIDVVSYEEINLSRSSNQRRITSRYLMIRENAIILIDHAVYGEKNENLHIVSNEFTPSIESILTSVKISKPLQKKNMIATVIQH